MAEKKINGTVYRVEPMLAMPALVLKARLFKIVGPAVAKLPALLRSASPDATQEEKNAANLAAVSAFTEVFAASKPEDVATLVKDIVEVARIHRPSGSYDHVDFDGDMSSRQGDIIALVVFVLREQFSDFFPGLRALGLPDPKAD